MLEMKRIILKRELFNRTGCRSVFLQYRTRSVRFFNEDEKPCRRKDVSSQNMKCIHDPKCTESGWYDWWESNGYFKPKDNEKVFSMFLPPPNITGTLHLGHALTISVQDVYMRWKRMKGENVLWIPGFDHAGIATEVMFEKYLKSVFNVTKHDIGREEFLERILKWKMEKESVIVEQMKLLGASVDWSKKYYTMDERSSKVVTEAFIDLYNRGLIARYVAPVKWCCCLKSSVSDSEIEEKKLDEPCYITVPGYDNPVEFGYMYRFIYKIWDNGKEGEEIEVWTTRPETILGDTAIAVNPKDLRYSHLKDKSVWNPFRKCKIPIVFEECVDPNVGSGVLKVTPAHSLIDFEIAKRHNLEIVNIFDENGLIKTTGHDSNFEGIKRFDARNKILDELQNLGLYKGKEKNSSVIPVCTRTGNIIEYIPKPQWFLECETMYNKIRKAISNGDIVFEPEFYKSLVSEWFQRGKNWNLSRQIWLGHRIPMYHCEGDGKKEWIPARSSKEARSLASNKFKMPPEKIEVTQDDDVLDTWFSSALLPLSLSGWPVLRNAFYPFGLVETGGDIIFFWVVRMLMLGQEITGKIPFDKILLHGMVCDSYGRKMSKSVGNVILPEDVITGISLNELEEKLEQSYRTGILSEKELKLGIKEQKKMFPNGIPKCGADALRLSFFDSDFRNDKFYFDVQLCRANTCFANKIWQAYRYFLNAANIRPYFSAEIPDENLSLFDGWILSWLAKTVESANEGIAQFQYYNAVQCLRIFLVKKFCCVYLENSKLVFDTDSAKDGRKVLSIMFNCLETSTRLLSPFMPFLSEELYHSLPKVNGFLPWESVTVAEYPESNIWSKYKNPQLEESMETFLDIQRAVRNARAFYKLRGQNVKGPPEIEDQFSYKMKRFLRRYSFVDQFSWLEDDAPERNVIVLNVKGCTLYIHHQHKKETLEVMLGPLLEKEEKLKKEFEKLQSVMSDPDHENEKEHVKKKKLSSSSNLSVELEKIKQVREVIERAEC